MGKRKRISKKKLLISMAAGYWTIYGRIHRRGWRKKYAGQMLKKAKNEKDWDRDREQLISSLKKSKPDMLKGFHFFLLKLKLFRFRVFCGALMWQDSLDQIHTPYRLIRRLVTNFRTNFIGNTLCSRDALDLCNNKARAAEYWNSWLNRNWRKLSPKEPLDLETLNRLMNGKTKIVVKPVASYGGKGVEILDIPERFGSPEQCLGYLNSLKKEYIVEEFVEQKGLIHTLNPSSVNTARIVTVRHPGGEIEIMNAYIRVGREGSVVDNVTSGGWFYVIDHHTGMMRKGRDGLGQCIPRLRKREDQPVPVPRWEEAVEFCRSAHRHAPEDLGYVGWDVCISDDGLCMIEINERPGLSQPYFPWENPWKGMRKLLNEFD